jgi:FixJ family two-component response regulator
MGTDTDTICVVDDAPAVRGALSSLLRASGKNVRLFTSGADFLSFEWDDTPACLILDLKIPRLNGPDVQRFVSVTIPIIFLTGR